MYPGLFKAKGDINCVISADAEVTPGTVLNVANIFNSNPGLDGLYGDWGFINTEGEEVDFLQPFRNSPLRMYPCTYHVSHSSLYLDRNSILNEELIFNE